MSTHLGWIVTKAPRGWLGKVILNIWEGEPTSHGGNLIGSLSISEDRVESAIESLKRAGIEYRVDAGDSTSS